PHQHMEFLGSKLYSVLIFFSRFQSSFSPYQRYIQNKRVLHPPAKLFTFRHFHAPLSQATYAISKTVRPFTAVVPKITTFYCLFLWFTIYS
ncbi:MAG: hypothetical protein PHO06_04030, partial [Clostridia bacterium]|nr:hypothetical protein [Clostridia bacterium]